MLVKYWMSKYVVTIEENDTMENVIKSLRKHNIRRLPVIKKDKLVGIVTDRDVKRVSASDATLLDVYELMYLISKIKVKNIMTRNPITVSPHHTVDEVAEILIENKIGGTPVIDSTGKVVGIITQTDIFRALISLSGLNKRGIQFALKVLDKPGSIKEITDIIREYGGRMVSILTSYDRVPRGYRLVYIRMCDIDRNSLTELKDRIQRKAELIYIVDHKKCSRELFE
ncbi:MAG: hypothetical protein DRG59_10750 [Deltaproteobacteria bacterium]|nr:MAG: hypothetical protein DRG59_10750 [Deltaproteobacteria bacterium]